MWPSSSSTTTTTTTTTTRQINYGLSPEMGMVGLRDVFVVAPAASFHHHTTHHDSTISDPNAAAAALGVGVIPLLTAAVDDDVLNSNRGRNSGIQFWQNQQLQHSSYVMKPMLFDSSVSTSANLLQSSGSGGGIGGLASNSKTTTTCQDCGNQAKKDCSHRRCRTCCKSRGFDCATHVKSTWVPAARRRERQLITAAAATTAAAGSSGSVSGAKKPKIITSQTTTTPSQTSTSSTPPSLDTSSSHQEASCKEELPGQVRAPAVLKFVRVTSLDDGDDEYAYQAVVKIGGHVFKGFLYDQGVIEGRDGLPNISDLHLGGGGNGNGNGNGEGRNGASSSSPIFDSSDVYAASGAGFPGGSSYGNQTN